MERVLTQMTKWPLEALVSTARLILMKVEGFAFEKAGNGTVAFSHSKAITLRRRKSFLLDTLKIGFNFKWVIFRTKLLKML